MHAEPTPLCPRATRADESRRDPRRDLLELAATPWTTRLGRETLLVRRSHPADLPAVAAMHGRCSRRSLLDRYRIGGRPPSVGALDAALRHPCSWLAIDRDGQVVATASLRTDPAHHSGCAEVGVLVEDRSRGGGLGTDLVAHLAGVAHVSGYAELIAYPATATAAVQRLMLSVGRTRRVVGPSEVHLHTDLRADAALGIGCVRARLAG